MGIMGGPPELRVFMNYLSKFKTERGSDHTHTSMEPRCSYYVSQGDMETFYTKYSAAVEALQKRGGMNTSAAAAVVSDTGDGGGGGGGSDSDTFSGLPSCLSITEKHKDVSPVLIDLDFRFPSSTMERRYDAEMVTAFLSLYLGELEKLVEIEGVVRAFVMERPHPRRDEKTGLLKDGLHIVIPDVATTASVQHIVRERVLEAAGDIFQSIGVCNSVEDVFDEAVICRNNWMMYGSTKPGSEPYDITYVYQYSVGGQLELENPSSEGEGEGEKKRTVRDIVSLLSIRNKLFEARVKKDAVFVVKKREDTMEEDELRKRVLRKAVGDTVSTFKSFVEDIDLARKLVDILSPERASNYNDWIRLGWCLRNVDDRMLSSWEGFSRKSEKFEEGVCESLWCKMRPGTLGIGSLHMWAKTDNPAEYAQLVSEDLNSLVSKSMSNDDFDIAKVIHRMFQHDFRCSSIKHRMWYEFRNHRWVMCENGHTLQTKMSTEVFNEYRRAANRRIAMIAETDDETLTAIYQKEADKLNKIAKSLKKNAFKETMIKECSGMFFDSKFEEKLDSNCSVLCFNNGVYDMDIQEFREGRPEDYCSFSTNIDYIPYDPKDRYVGDIENYFSQVIPDQEVRDYVLTVLASAVDGNIREEKFHIWTGSGANGKSATIDFFERCLGDYSCKFNVSMLTSRRVASNSTNSEIVRAKGKRFAVLQEPQEDEKMNVGIMKELTGGDRIIARGLYKEPIEFKPQFKMVLTCNHLPMVPADDGGTWRRIRLVEFTSRFCRDPSPDKPNEFPIDPRMSEKFDEWKQTFMSMLIERYKHYVRFGMTEPEAVLKCTRNYQKSNDMISEFLEMYLMPDANGSFAMNELYDRFKAWFRNENGPSKPPRKKDVQTYIEKNGFKKIPGLPASKPMFSGHILVDDDIEEPPSAAMKMLPDEF